MRLVILVQNDCRNDPRVTKEAKLAAQRGHEVHVIATRTPDTPCWEQQDGVTFHRVEGSWWGPGYLRCQPATLRMLAGLTRRWLFDTLSRPLEPIAPALVESLRDGWKRWRQPARRQASGQAPGVGVATGGVARPRRRGWRRQLGQWYSEGYVFARLADDHREMTRLARALAPDLIQATDLPMLLPALAAAEGDCRVVYDAHELYVGMSPDTSRAYDALCWLIERGCIGRVHRVVTVNDEIADELRSRYRIPRPDVVMNCPFREPLPERRDRLRRELGVAPEQPIILYQGRFEPGRGLEQLIEAGRYLQRGVIVIRGYGSTAAELEALAADPGLGGRVRLVPPVPMAELVAAAGDGDIGVIPYRSVTAGYHYASPNKLFEYMMAGLAIAASDLPVLRRVVLGGGLGAVFDAEDPRAIAAALDTLTADPDALGQMQQLARESAWNRYCWEVEGNRLVDLYEQTVRG